MNFIIEVVVTDRFHCSINIKSFWTITAGHDITVVEAIFYQMKRGAQRFFWWNFNHDIKIVDDVDTLYDFEYNVYLFVISNFDG